MHLLITLVGLAISFAVPAFSQEKETIASQIDEQIVKKFDEAFNNGDAAAVAALLHRGRSSGDSARTGAAECDFTS